MKSILLSNEKCMVGEIGIDYMNKEIDLDKQREIFENQLDLAIELNKSVVIHSVRAYSDLVKILKKKFKKRKIRKVSINEYFQAKESLENGGIEIGSKKEKKLKKIIRIFHHEEKEFKNESENYCYVSRN